MISGISDVEIQLLMTQDFTHVIQGTLEQVRAISIVIDILFYVYSLATLMYFLKNASLNNIIQLVFGFFHYAMRYDNFIPREIEHSVMQ